MPPQIWKTLSTREIYKNKWMRRREDIAELPPDATEFFERAVLPFAEVLALVQASEIRDTSKA